MQYGLPEAFADELPFIREILFDVTDDTPRMIYADWLSDRNDPRGEFLRIDEMMAGLDRATDDYERLRKQREELMPKVDWQWASLLARLPIERCPQPVEFEFLCPKRWENSKPFGDDQSVRYCDDCGKSVTYCATIDAAQENAIRGQCVAVDISVMRKPDDLNEVHREFGEFLGIMVDSEQG